MGIWSFKRFWVSYNKSDLEFFFEGAHLKKSLRFICLQDLNERKVKCVDFEARFCCPKTKRRRSIVIPTEPPIPEFINLPTQIDDLRILLIKLIKKYISDIFV